MATTTEWTHPADLEPSLVAARTYASRRRAMSVDAASLIVVVLWTLYLVPASLVFADLSDIGRPASMLCLVMWSWWIFTRLSRRFMMPGPQPMRWAVLVYMISALMSYAAGMFRGLTGLEANAAERGMIAILQFTGILLLAADGITNWDRLHRVLRVMVWGACTMAVIGILQSTVKLDLTEYMVRYLRIPGLKFVGNYVGADARGAGFYRVASTATHYIEFSTIMALALPFAIHYARFASELKHRRLFTVAAVLIGAALPLTISRTGIVALAAILLALVPIWRWRMRYNFFVLMIGMMAAFMVVRPGLMGTLRSMFTNTANDDSIQGRTERYALVFKYFAERPWFGRGTGTYVPPQYQILDNQWLGTLVSTGALGVAALLTLHVVAISITVISLRRSTSPEIRHLCACLIGAQLAGVVVGYTFDSLAFTTYSTTIALLMGICGAVWRFTHPAKEVRTSMVAVGLE